MPGIRVATFNVSLNRKSSGELTKALRSKHAEQARHVAQQIALVKPDILVIQELDKGEGQENLELFYKHYLQPALNEPKDYYPYRQHFESNTGQSTGLDLDRNGRLGDASDAQGFGFHSGQYAFAILSRFRFETSKIREFRRLLWRDMPDHHLNQISLDGMPWYDESARAIMRLSSKNHVAVPIHYEQERVWFVIAHPTPPVFDGREDRNGWRNYDELRLLRLIMGPEKVVRSDNGELFAIPEGDHFIILGDLNADPNRGDSRPGAVQQLLEHPRILVDAALGSRVPARPKASKISRTDTSTFGLRVDYILPSTRFKVSQGGLCAAPTHRIEQPSDHFLVWMDLRLPAQPSSSTP